MQTLGFRHRALGATGRIALATLALLAGAATAPAHAAEEDGQVWTALNATTDLGERAVLTVEGQVRVTDDASRIGQYLVRPSIGLKLDQTTTASVGYAFVHTDPVGPGESAEHRLWQQIAFRIAGDGQGVTLTGRSRLEQRWVEGAAETGWRFRQQVRLTAPLAGKVRAAVWSEAFINLDDTAWGQAAGLDRWRNSVALSVPLTSAITLEPGYINQWVNRPGPDRVHHIANMTIAARF